MFENTMPGRIKTSTRPTLVACLMGAWILSGCGSDPQPPPKAPEPAPAPAADPGPPADPTPVPETQSQLNISDEILRACGIKAPEAFFDFDSSAVRSAAHDVLKKVAECFTSGPLKGRQMRLVGHADPRGTEEYNLTLGNSRADSVKDYMVKQGLPSSQATTTSRGEMEASGTDEAGYARDRRVDVRLAK